jgi:predicted transcriptional regulator
MPTIPTIIKMHNKRSSDKIIAQILETCKEGASKTKIVYACNLNFKNAAVYLASLTKNNLIDAGEGTHVLYKTTEMGLEALENLRPLQDLVSDLVI